MLNAQHHKITRKSDLDLRKKFNQLFDDFVAENDDMRNRSWEYGRDTYEEAMENKVTPTFKLFNEGDSVNEGRRG